MCVVCVAFRCLLCRLRRYPKFPELLRVGRPALALALAFFADEKSRTPLAVPTDSETQLLLVSSHNTANETQI